MSSFVLCVHLVLLSASFLFDDKKVWNVALVAQQKHDHDDISRKMADSTRRDLLEILQFRLHNLIVCHLTHIGVEFCFWKTVGGLALCGCSAQVCVHSLPPQNCRNTRCGDRRFVEQCLFWQQPFLCVSAGHARAPLLAQSMHKH